MYSLNESNGQLISLRPTTIETGAGPDTVTLDPSRMHIYTTNYYGTSISVYNINTLSGQLSLNSTVSNNGQNPTGITFSANGAFAYVSNYGNSFAPYLSSVSIYSVDTTTGTLTALSPATVTISDGNGGGNPFVITTDPAKSYVYVANGSGSPTGTIDWFSLNSSSGLLTSSGSLGGVVSSPGDIVFSPVSNFAYTIDKLAAPANIYSLNFDPTTGTISSTGFSINTADFSEHITLNSTGKFMYVTNGINSGVVSMYSVDTTTGTLTALSPATVSAGITPEQVTFSPSGNYAYVTSRGTKQILMYNVGLVTPGVLTPLSPGPTSVSTQSNPTSMVFR